jgi:hypothetical protein
MEDLWEKEMYGGTASSGFIQAMMAKESGNDKVHAKFEGKIAKHNEKISKKQAKGDKRVRKGELTKEYINDHKFQSMDTWDIDRMSKATKNLISHKELTVAQAVKAFYAWLLKEAKQHDPLTGEEDGKPVNYRGTFDIEPKFDEWKTAKKVVVKEPKQKPKPKAEEKPKPVDTDDWAERRDRERAKERHTIIEKAKADTSKYGDLHRMIVKYNTHTAFMSMTDAEKRKFVKDYKQYQEDEDIEDYLPYLNVELDKLTRSLRFQ